MMEVDVAGVEEVKRVITEKKVPKLKKKKTVSPKGIPSSVTLDDILNSLPKDVFTQDRLRAYTSLLITLMMLAFSILLLARAPWFIWPVAWVIGGAAVTGLFAIGHDCVHRAFAKSKIVNDIVGTILMLPLGYSFYSWKTCHRYQRSQPANGASSSNAFVNEIWNWAKGHTFWFASLGYWAQQHFDISYYKPEDRLRITISNYGVLAFGVVFFSSLFWYTGIVGIVKYWLLPWLGYHVLMSTTTLLPTVVLDEKSASTLVHLSYPKWLEFITNDISITLPRSVSTSIPHYRLRQAYQSLKKQWGEYFLEINFDWDLVTELLDRKVPRDDFDPLSLKSLPIPEAENTIKSGEINPVPQATQGFSGWMKSVKAFVDKVNWVNTSIIVATPFIGLYGLYTCTPSTYTVMFAVLYYFLTGMGITAGYHRLFSHRAFKVKYPTHIALLMLGTGAGQGSAKWWCRNHRAHHRYIDTDKDPYNALKGFWYSHVGWMCLKQDHKKVGWASIDDLNADPWIRWQHTHYGILALVMSILVPTFICGLWGDFVGGYFYAAILRQVFVHHSTFLVNSLAHFWGLAPFADEHTPRDSVLTAVLTLGEGYHNFHHEFPSDYRNAIKFYQYDPTKWVIASLSYLGQAYDLKVFPKNTIKTCQLQMKQKELEKMNDSIDWGTPLEQLPVITRECFDRVCAEGFKLIIINGVVHDVTDFILEHPGGSKIMEPYSGKDATKAFTGGVYYHSNAARNILNQYRVGTIAKNDNWSFVEPVNVEERERQSKKHI